MSQGREPFWRSISELLGQSKVTFLGHGRFQWEKRGWRKEDTRQGFKGWLIRKQKRLTQEIFPYVKSGREVGRVKGLKQVCTLWPPQTFTTQHSRQVRRKPRASSQLTNHNWDKYLNRGTAGGHLRWLRCCGGNSIPKEKQSPAYVIKIKAASVWHGWDTKCLEIREKMWMDMFFDYL